MNNIDRFAMINRLDKLFSVGDHMSRTVSVSIHLTNTTRFKFIDTLAFADCVNRYHVKWKYKGGSKVIIEFDIRADLNGLIVLKAILDSIHIRHAGEFKCRLWDVSKQRIIDKFNEIRRSSEKYTVHTTQNNALTRAWLQCSNKRSKPHYESLMSQCGELSDVLRTVISQL